ncbi:multicopper oxidase [Rossellomorea aquimaris]|uniref:multicopper oxidase family protein n=1 Tax=Rossellomorea aquimaris TaxID=189382 RepID=UPI001CD44222|nr:multicopper oxidase [Rossellomorea aquimaris]MCA1054034.1 multicopper oxidase [Rossellomorea aquimaris]
MLEKFVDPLPIMNHIQPTALINNQPYYEVTMIEMMQKLHRDLPPTKIWGYNGQYPGPTFRVWKNQPIHVLWKNELPQTHFLPLDRTIHGAGQGRPEVRTVVHLHGGVTPHASDGYPEAWFTKGFQQVGPYFTKGLYTYPNHQDATALWYHDHAMGITRLNIYAGLAGMYIIHDEEEQRLDLPTFPYEIPLIIQDRSFNRDGSLFYPSQPDVPVPGVHPSAVPEFFADTILVNGKVWPYLEVEQGIYRFRLLNGSNARFYRISLSNGLPFVQIGTDQGLLPSPVEVPKLILAPAERADVLVDFRSSDTDTMIMLNDAETSFPNGKKPDPHTTGTVMQFRIKSQDSTGSLSRIPSRLTSVPTLLEKQTNKTRRLILNRRMDWYGRHIHLLDNHLWNEPVSENPSLWSMETWSLINVTDATHPIHLHLVRFQILDRQTFDQNLYKKEGHIVPAGPRRRPEPTEQGWKDTVRANPGEITRIIVPFGPYTGLFVWHCHILEHEDHEMMRPYYVWPS